MPVAWVYVVVTSHRDAGERAGVRGHGQPHWKVSVQLDLCAKARTGTTAHRGSGLS